MGGDWPTKVRFQKEMKRDNVEVKFESNVNEVLEEIADHKDANSATIQL